jgi:hypothetical protein
MLINLILQPLNICNIHQYPLQYKLTLPESIMININKHSFEKNKLFISLSSHVRDIEIIGTESSLEKLIVMARTAIKNNKEPVISRFYPPNGEYFDLHLSVKDSDEIEYATPNVYQCNSEDRPAEGNLSIIFKIKNNKLLSTQFMQGYYKGEINYIDNATISTADLQKINILAINLKEYITNCYKNISDLVNSVCELPSFFKSEYIKSIDNEFCNLMNKINNNFAMTNDNTHTARKRNNYKIINIENYGGHYDSFITDMTPTAMQSFHNALINARYKHKTKRSVMYAEDTANRPFSITISNIGDQTFRNYATKRNNSYYHTDNIKKSSMGDDEYRLIVNFYQSAENPDASVDGYLVNNELLVKVL